jgi:SAM-dependent methyltransferase
MRLHWGKGRKAPGAASSGGLCGDRMSDDAFLKVLYRRMLDREPDAEGMAIQLEAIRQGMPRSEIVLNFASSPEFIHKTIKDNLAAYIDPLPIRDERPDRYRIERRKGAADQVRVFRAAEDVDYDWLERKIVANGYYERPGVWSFIVDEDKRMMADIANELGARTVLDFGCSNGAVLKCLRDLGIDGEGVEISRMALDKAPLEVRESIHLGDLLSLSLPRRYDLVLGLDVFEHLNPNRLDAYLSRLFGLIREGGRLFANVPAHGRDPVFGEIFPLDLASWDEDVAAGRCFRSVPVDDYGYPKNGHIIGGGTDWWVGRFERAGFRRDRGIETSLHRTFDEGMSGISLARRAYYVFSR